MTFVRKKEASLGNQTSSSLKKTNYQVTDQPDECSGLCRMQQPSVFWQFNEAEQHTTSHSCRFINMWVLLPSGAAGISWTEGESFSQSIKQLWTAGAGRRKPCSFRDQCRRIYWLSCFLCIMFESTDTVLQCWQAPFICGFIIYVLWIDLHCGIYGVSFSIIITAQIIDMKICK